MKVCKRCQLTKNKTDFYKVKKSKDGLQGQCKVCIIKQSKSRSKRLYATDPEFRKQKVRHAEKSRLQRQYGITLEERQGLLEKQQFRCAVCNKHQDELKQILDIDHDHKTGKVRGMLCWRCNRAEGLLLSNPQLAIKLAEYMSLNGVNND